MFHFPAFPLPALCIQTRVTRHDSCRVTPFGNPGITARLTAPPGLSRPPTSFIGSWYQGIHHLPYTTSTKNQDKKDRTKSSITQITRCSRPLCTSQPTTNHHPPAAPDTRTQEPQSLNPCRYTTTAAINLARKPKPAPTGDVLVFSGPNRVCLFRHATGCAFPPQPPTAFHTQAKKPRQY